MKLLVRLPKVSSQGPTAWRNDTIPPRLSPYPKARPTPDRGLWRSMFVTSDTRRFIVFAIVQEHRDDFKAFLAVEQQGIWRVLVRLEYHGNHPGLHVHDWCGSERQPVGGKSFEAPNRRPKIGRHHRRTGTLSRAGFWKLALDRFRVIPSVAYQEELL